MMSSAQYNISHHLPRMAQQQPETTALYLPQKSGREYRHYSFRELEQESNRVAFALEKAGVGRGVHTALMVKPGLDFFALTFALFKIGAVPVLIDPGIGIKNLKACLNEAEPEVFIGIPQAHLARILFRWAGSTLKKMINVGPLSFPGISNLRKLTPQVDTGQPYPVAATASDETAAILFTSGSTGIPKGAVYSHGNFIAQVEQLRQLYDIRPGEIDLPTFPLFALFAPALGMSSVIPVMDFTRPGSVDPTRIIEPIRQFKATTMFGSPALINRVGRYGSQHQLRLPSLKRVISAGAPVAAAVLERFSTLLADDVQIFTPYGATESLPVCSIGSREIVTETRRLTEEGRGVCIGRPVADIQLEIIAICDEAIASWNDDLKLADGEIGEIVVKGPQVTRSYFNRPQSTALAKIEDPHNGGFFHRMGDLGYRDEQGRIWFCGRKSHRVSCPGETLFTIPCEAIFNTHPQVYRSALVGIGKPGAMVPVICIELENKKTGPEEQQRIRSELLDIARQHPLIRPIDQILFHPGFPVDIRHNAKIFREKLALWAGKKLS